MVNFLKHNSNEVNSRLVHDQYNTIIFNLKKDVDIFLVGGFIRDIFINREGLERDFVIKGKPGTFLNSLARSLQGKAVTIGKKDLHRLVLENGMHFDFTTLRGTIETDLADRDFTVNSLAWSPETGIIDCSSGVRDISKRTIRMVSRNNLKNDPLRILRAYRLAGELSFRIDPSTRMALSKMNQSLKQVKSERITLEFYKILNSDHPENILRMMLRDGILHQIICLSNRELQRRLKEITHNDELFHKIHLRNKFKSDDIFSDNLSFKGLGRLEVIFSGMPDSLLKMSSRLRKRLSRLHKAGKLLRNRKKIDRTVLYDIFMITEDAALDFLVINGLAKYVRDIERFESARTKRVLSNKEIIEHTGVIPGRPLGLLIETLKRANFEGKADRKKEAIKFLKSRLQSNLT